jgi:uncharacterized membrane protein
VEPITAIEVYGVRKYLRVCSAYRNGLRGAAEVTSAMSRRHVHRLFAVSILIKGVDGVLETIGGILLLLVSPKALNSLVISFTALELSEDPDEGRKS